MSAIADDKVPPYAIFSDTEADTAFHEESGSHDVVLKNIITEEVTKDSDDDDVTKDSDDDVTKRTPPRIPRKRLKKIRISKGVSLFKTTILITYSFLWVSLSKTTHVFQLFILLCC